MKRDREQSKKDLQLEIKKIKDKMNERKANLERFTKALREYSQDTTKELKRPIKSEFMGDSETDDEEEERMEEMQKQI